MEEKKIYHYVQVEIKTKDGKILSSKEELDAFIKKIQSAFDTEKIRPYLECFSYRIDNGFIFLCKEGVSLIESRIHNFGHIIHELK